jgi:hypothetical protein
MNTKNLRAEIQRITQPNGRRYFSKELQAKVKAAVFSLKKSGASQVKIAETLTISQMTVCRYLRDEALKPTPIRPVSVAVRATQASKVTTPLGFEVEGLDVEDIVTLIRSLS